MERVYHWSIITGKPISEHYETDFADGVVLVHGRHSGSGYLSSWGSASIAAELLEQGLDGKNVTRASAL